MSPLSACPQCGRGGCKRHRPRPPGRRAYSDTAAYRQMRYDVLELHGQTCVYCHEPIDEDDVVLAHVIPHRDGGPFELENLRPAHRSCNASAGADAIEDTHG